MTLIVSAMTAAVLSLRQRLREKIDALDRALRTRAELGVDAVLPDRAPVERDLQHALGVDDERRARLRGVRGPAQHRIHHAEASVRSWR